jgi:hypothetical protein
MCPESENNGVRPGLQLLTDPRVAVESRVLRGEQQELIEKQKY